MAFSLTRPPSPARDYHVSLHDDDHLSSALHAALSAFAPTSSAHSDHHDMTKEKGKAGIDIVVDSDCLLLRGTGVDVEPTLLKGHIVLHLTEATSIKEITLQFRGKARLLAPSGDSLALNMSSHWYSICNHEWSFLEGEKRHSHTLKAGFHQFPFQLQLGGSLPSSIVSAVYGGAHVSYKLRAVAVRPGLAHNMQAVMPISIVRTFAPAALEYQQSLEIENTWPEKLMYSIMLPHKAWAAGDELVAVVKFSPIAKGVRVQTVTTTINETTKLQCRGGVQEHTRPVITMKHEFVNGNAVSVAERHGFRMPTLQAPQGQQQTPFTSGLSSEDRSQSFGSLMALANQDLMLRQVPSTASSSSSQESHSLSGASPLGSHSASSAEQSVASTSTAAQVDPEGELQISQDDVVTQISITIPKTVTPSHSLDPIVISHRIRWSILLSNLDGHTSELRCSLPLHILDPRLLDEARANSTATRRLLLEGPEAPADEEQVIELPSYSAHIRDRVANMYLPDSVTTRVLNPWVHSNVSPTFMPENRPLSGDWTHSGAASPFMPHHPDSSHLPHVPQSGTSTPLDWINSELLLSLSHSAPPLPQANASSHVHSPSDPASRSGSRPESRLMSRRGSRAPSPERHLTMSSISSTMSISTAHETFVHGGQASRSSPGLFSNQMKPVTSHGWLSSRSNSHSNLSSLAEISLAHRQGHGHGQGVYGGHAHAHGHGQSLYSSGAHHGHVSHSTRAANVPPTPTSATDNLPESAIWHRAFTEVPDYGVASRGFIGGVTPLTSMRGLPSYEEAERSAGARSSRGEEEEGMGLTMGRRYGRDQPTGGS